MAWNVIVATAKMPQETKIRHSFNSQALWSLTNNNKSTVIFKFSFFSPLREAFLSTRKFTISTPMVRLGTLQSYTTHSSEIVHVQNGVSYFSLFGLVLGPQARNSEKCGKVVSFGLFRASGGVRAAPLGLVVPQLQRHADVFTTAVSQRGKVLGSRSFLQAVVVQWGPPGEARDELMLHAGACLNGQHVFQVELCFHEERVPWRATWRFAFQRNVLDLDT